MRLGSPPQNARAADKLYRERAKRFPLAQRHECVVKLLYCHVSIVIHGQGFCEAGQYDTVRRTGRMPVPRQTMTGSGMSVPSECAGALSSHTPGGTVPHWGHLPPA